MHIYFAKSKALSSIWVWIFWQLYTPAILKLLEYPTKNINEYGVFLAWCHLDISKLFRTLRTYIFTRQFMEFD